MVEGVRLDAELEERLAAVAAAAPKHDDIRRSDWAKLFTLCIGGAVVLTLIGWWT